MPQSDLERAEGLTQQLWSITVRVSPERLTSRNFHPVPCVQKEAKSHGCLHWEALHASVCYNPQEITQKMFIAVLTRIAKLNRWRKSHTKSSKWELTTKGPFMKGDLATTMLISKPFGNVEKTYYNAKRERQDSMWASYMCTMCLSKMFIFSEAFKGSTKKWKCIRGMKLKILSLCSLIDQISDKDSTWPTKTPIHVELHCFPNKLLAVEFLSQVSEGSQTNVGLFLGLGCLGRRAWTAFWFFLQTQCPI